MKKWLIVSALALMLAPSTANTDWALYTQYRRGLWRQRREPRASHMG
jgi:hypothetical protein